MSTASLVPASPRALPSPSGSDWSVGVSHDTHWHTMFGFIFLGLVALGFGVWSTTAMIAGAIMTSGTFVAIGENKSVQHLEGGIIRDIKVAEGDVVSPGQVLLVLDDTAPKAELRRLQLRSDRLLATEARLQAEVTQRDALTFPAELMNRASDSDLPGIMAGQILAFEAWRRNLDSSVAVLKDGIVAIDEKIKGTEVQRQSVTRQIQLLDQELTAKVYLLSKEIIRKPEVLALQRARANADGEIGRLDGDIGDARERIARTREQVQEMVNATVKQATEQLQDALAEENDVRERMRAAKGVLDRISITAPVRGIVVKLRYHSVGGVVESGKTILEIVPTLDDLLIEAHVRPQDIEHVRRGQSATVRLTAMSQRLTPMIGGEVVYVSADALSDDRRMQAGDFYVVRIRLDPKEAGKLSDFSPTSGMPAEVYIKTTERTFFDYLTKPLRDSMGRAFHEI